MIIMLENPIQTYKAFNKVDGKLVNRYKRVFEIGKEYFIEGEIRFGNNGNGFHSCKNLEDTLRYFDFFNEECTICTCEIKGEISVRNDEYYGYYDQYSSSYLKLLKDLSRDEIISYAKQIRHNDIALERFIRDFYLTQEEIDYFRNKYKRNPHVLHTLDYFKGTTEDYQMKLKSY